MMSSQGDVMRRLMLCVGVGFGLIAGNACTASPTTPLARAAAANDAVAVRRLLAAGHLPDETPTGDAGPVRGTADATLTPLMWAARRGAVDAMAALVDAGARVDARDSRNEWTALQHAVHTRHAAAALLLLDRGADPNGRSAPGRLTPLLMAADDRDATVVAALLKHGADPRMAGEYGDTPLTRAVSGGALTDIDRPLLGGCRPATVRALLAHDPALRLPDNFAGRQALRFARFHDCGEVLELVAPPQSARADSGK
ncbi:MAG TPA: ankyrin repeat domain-containing protein [Vicinamibacterales bacterium]